MDDTVRETSSNGNILTPGHCYEFRKPIRRLEETNMHAFLRRISSFGHKCNPICVLRSVSPVVSRSPGQDSEDNVGASGEPFEAIAGLRVRIGLSGTRDGTDHSAYRSM